jgi:segregation and condensation protein B
METRVSLAAVKLVDDVPDLPDHWEAMRVAEALLFASAEPLSAADLAVRLPEGANVEAILQDLAKLYASRGVNLVQVAGKWAFRTAGDLAYLLSRDVVEQKKLSRPAMETLAIIAYHQPVTRAEIEDIRGVATSKGTLDLLLETGWVRLRGRRRVPGRPVTYGTTPAFLEHFGLDAIGDLPGLEELKGAGFIEGRISSALSIPTPSDAEALAEDEDPLDGDEMFALPDLDMHDDEKPAADERPDGE